jgi:hypothetical protein
LHEILNEFHRKEDFGSLFKVNFEKTYDNINWIFVQNHEVERFFYRHIMNVMIYEKVCGKVNNELCPCYVRLDLGVERPSKRGSCHIIIG